MAFTVSETSRSGRAFDVVHWSLREVMHVLGQKVKTRLNRYDDNSQMMLQWLA